MRELELANKLEAYFLRLAEKDSAYKGNLRLVREWKLLLDSDDPSEGELDALIESLEADDICEGSGVYELETSLRGWCLAKRSG